MYIRLFAIHHQMAFELFKVFKPKFNIIFLFTSTLSLTTTGESTTRSSLLCYSNQLFMCGEHTQLTWLGGEPLGCRGLLYIFFLLFYGFSFCFCCFDLLCMYVCVCSFNNILWGEYLVVCICSQMFTPPHRCRLRRRHSGTHERKIQNTRKKEEKHLECFSLEFSVFQKPKLNVIAYFLFFCCCCCKQLTALSLKQKFHFLSCSMTFSTIFFSQPFFQFYFCFLLFNLLSK